MINKLISLAFLLVVILLTPSTILAHVLKTDGTIGAVLHIDPEDDPIANQPSNLFFEFKDKQNKFQPQNCDCIFTIAESGKQIYSQPLYANSTNPDDPNASISFTFLEKNVYQVQVSGKPLTPNTFQAFKLSYNIRVARVTDTTNPPIQPTLTINHWLTLHIPHIVVGSIITIFLLFGIIRLIKRKPNRVI